MFWRVMRQNCLYRRARVGAAHLSRAQNQKLRKKYRSCQHQLTTTMDKHALAVLQAAESWEWPLTYHISKDQGSKFRAVTPKLLSGFIAESRALGGTLVDKFWDVVGQCHPRLVENSASISPPAWTSSADISLFQLKSFGTRISPPLVILKWCYLKGSIEKRSTSVQYFRWAQNSLPIFALLVGPDTNLLRNW